MKQQDVDPDVGIQVPNPIMLKHIRNLTDLVRYLRRARRNMIEAWPTSYYRRLFIEVECPGRMMYVLNDPQDIQHVMVTHFKNYRKSPTTNQVLKPLLRNSMFITEGENWSRSRKIMTPAFHKGLMETYANTMVQCARDLLETWEAQPEGSEVDLTREMTLVTADVVSRTMFHFLLREQVDDLYEAFVDYQASHGRVHMAELLGLPSWIPRPGLIKGTLAVRRFDHIIQQIFDERGRSDAPPHDLLSMLMAFRDEGEEPLSRDQVRDEIAVIFLAGHETTATTLMWALYLLDQHPEIQRRAREEIESVLSDRDPKYADVEQLPFIRAIVDETLRLYPPVHAFSREALGPDTLPTGKTIKKRSLITIPAYVLHRHQEHWKEPEAFRPDRFLPENKDQVKRYSYIPFGAGPRLCLGKFFGLTEAVIVLSMVLQRFTLTLREGHPVEPLGRMTLRPHLGLPMKLQTRKKQPAET